MTLTEFIKKYTGVKCGNTNGNFGQCTGLVSLWIANMGLSHCWGNARDIYKNASSLEWGKTLNKIDIYPVAGDVIVWDGSMGGGFGHIAIVVSSSEANDTFTVFEQNNPLGSAPLKKTYKNWNGVIGWLHPLTVNEVESSPSILDTDIPTEVEERFGLKNISRYNKRWSYGDFIVDWVEMTDEIEELDATIKAEASSNKTRCNLLDNTISALETKLGASGDTLKIEVKKYSDLEKKYDTTLKSLAVKEEECQVKGKEIATMKDLLEKTPSDIELKKRCIDLEKRCIDLQAKSFDEWIKTQDWKTKLVSILDIVRSVV